MFTFGDHYRIFSHFSLPATAAGPAAELMACMCGASMVGSARPQRNRNGPNPGLERQSYAPPTRVSTMAMAESSNPFSGFFSSVEAVEQQKSSVVQQRCEIGYALTRVFLCTPNSSVEGHADRPRFVVSLPQLSRDQERLGKSGDLDLDTLTQVQCAYVS